MTIEKDLIRKFRNESAKSRKFENAQWEKGTLQDIGAYEDTPALILKIKDYDDSWGAETEEFCIASLHKDTEDPSEPAFLSLSYDGYGDGYSAATVKQVIDKYNSQENDHCLQKYGKLPYPTKELCKEIGLGEVFEAVEGRSSDIEFETFGGSISVYAGFDIDNDGKGVSTIGLNSSSRGSIYFRKIADNDADRTNSRQNEQDANEIRAALKPLADEFDAKIKELLASKGYELK